MSGLNGEKIIRQDFIHKRSRRRMICEPKCEKSKNLLNEKQSYGRNTEGKHQNMKL